MPTILMHGSTCLLSSPPDLPALLCLPSQTITNIHPYDRRGPTLSLVPLRVGTFSPRSMFLLSLASLEEV